jgi:adenylosuccinate synthase
LARGAARHGSCGQGIGETRRYWLEHGDDAVTAGDLANLDALWQKLELQRQRVLLEIQELPCESEVSRRLAADLYGQSARDLAEEMHSFGRRLQLSSVVPDYLTAIFEGAQGVLLDEWRGFHPYTTWSTVTQHYALELAAQSGAEELCALGLTRAYATRHGAGPFPTEDAELKLTDDGNPRNAWQHGMRFGHLDLVLLRYALSASGGALDGLVVNCLDQIGDDARLCVAYDGMAPLVPAEAPNLKHQEDLTRQLFSARPVYQPVSVAELQTRLADLRPLAILGHGATWRDRRLLDLKFRRKHAHAA